MNLKTYLIARQKMIDRALDRFLPKENAPPPTIHKSTRRYSISEMFREISIAAGSRKLIAGQVADLEAEGKKVSRHELRYIHENKTAAMITTSVRLGAMSANADAKKLRAITKFGYALGLAFQVIDDILDVTQTSEKLGKSAGKDVAAQKAT